MICLEDLEKEAKGICPATDMNFFQCLAGPCDCFLTRNDVATYQASCNRELERLRKREAGDEEPVPETPSDQSRALVTIQEMI